MEYTTRLGSGPRRAHVNYQCPCGCTGGVIYNAEKPLSKAGACCCGRKLWVGTDAETMLRPYLVESVEYLWDVGSVTLPWGEVAPAAMAWPKDGVPAGEGDDHEHDHDDHGIDGDDAIEVGEPALVLDVVCGMRIYPHDAAATSEHNGVTFYFCAMSCKQRFDANPEGFASAAAS